MDSAKLGGKEKPAAGEPTTFSARLPRATKNVLQRAAELRGQSLSDFVLGSAYERALATIRGQQLIEISTRDAEIFATALLSPPAISEAIVARFAAAHERSQR